MKLPIYDLVFDENSLEDGVDKISFVDKPAIEVNFITFSKQEKVNYKLSSDKQIITTPILIADKEIYRNDNVLGEYNVVFKKDIIEKIVQKYFKDNNGFKFNTDHKNDVSGVYIFESYIVNRERGINPPIEFNDISDGSWIGSFKVDNIQLWSDIKSGKFKGVSVECFMGYVQQLNTNKDNSIIEEEEMINYLNSIVKELGKIK